MALLRIGTRKSPLALAQAEQVKCALLEADTSLSPDEVALVPFVTEGDKGTSADAKNWGLKGLFTKELEEALLSSQIDIAVHSMKDMPSVLPAGLMIAAMLEREDARDGFISTRHTQLHDLPQGAIIGTSSTRRRAQIKKLRPDITITPLRGNVGTRIDKLSAGDMDATFLAVAGLNRLGLSQHITHAIALEDMLPAVAQGAIGIECREGDDALRERLASINHIPTQHCVETERSLLAALGGSCQSPIAAHAVMDGTYVSLHAELLAADGSAHVAGHIMAPIHDGMRAGHELGKWLLSRSAHFFTP
jgi:hydroxymethylbilane synthase